MILVYKFWIIKINVFKFCHICFDILGHYSRTAFNAAMFGFFAVENINHCVYCQFITLGCFTHIAVEMLEIYSK